MRQVRNARYSRKPTVQAFSKSVAAEVIHLDSLTDLAYYAFC